MEMIGVFDMILDPFETLLIIGNLGKSKGSECIIIIHAFAFFPTCTFWAMSEGNPHPRSKRTKLI